MFENVVKLQEKTCTRPPNTGGDQAVSRPIAAHMPLQTPRETNRLLSETSSPMELNNSNGARPGSYDLEKGSLEWHLRSPDGSSYNHSRLTHVDQEDDSDEDGPKEHAIWILIYLSSLSPILALPIALYTLLIGTLLLLLFPLWSCVKQTPMCARLHYFLSPALSLQLGLVYSSYNIAEPVPSGTSGAVVLSLIFMLSPLYAVVLAVATWIAGVFWFYTAILGNPDGKEDRDDGREAVLAVRRWWEKWLVQSLEPRSHSTLRVGT